MFLCFQRVILASKESHSYDKQNEHRTDPDTSHREGDKTLESAHDVEIVTQSDPASAPQDTDTKPEPLTQEKVPEASTELATQTFQLEVSMEVPQATAHAQKSTTEVSGISQIWDTPARVPYSDRVTTALFIGLCVSGFVQGAAFNFRNRKPVELAVRILSFLMLRFIYSLLLSHFCQTEGVGLFGSRTYLLFHAAAMPVGILAK